MSLPLDDIRVVDLTIARAGPQCVRQLADWGADVVRVEPPSDPAGVRGQRRPQPPSQQAHRAARPEGRRRVGRPAAAGRSRRRARREHAAIGQAQARVRVGDRARPQPTPRVRVDLGLRARRSVRRSGRRGSDRARHGRADERHGVAAHRTDARRHPGERPRRRGSTSRSASSLHCTSGSAPASDAGCARRCWRR